MSELPARVDVVLAYGTPEESFASVARCGSVVFPRRPVAADGTERCYCAIIIIIIIINAIVVVGGGIVVVVGGRVTGVAARRGGSCARRVRR